MSVSTVYNVVWLFFVLVGLLSGNLISGLLSMTLAGKKGYTGYFWTGFLLGLAGLIYVAGLPDNRPHAR